MQSSYEIGKDAEARAVHWFLANRVSRILRRNYRFRGGEIDFIAEEIVLENQRRRRELVFVEVRARVSERSWLDPLESLSPKKRSCLKRAAERYLSAYRGKATSLRFDLLTWNAEKWEHRMNILLE